MDRWKISARERDGRSGVYPDDGNLPAPDARFGPDLAMSPASGLEGMGVFPFLNLYPPAILSS